MNKATTALTACAAALIVSACSPSQQTSLGKGFTPEEHVWFPVAAGAHALGQTGFGRVSGCEACHEPNTESFAQFTCVRCHAHDRRTTDRLHLTVQNYSYVSKECWSCHPEGAKVPFDHAGIADECAACHDTDAPFAAFPAGHLATGGADCGGCHTTSGWAGGSVAPSTLAYDPAASVTVDALVPVYMGTSIAAVNSLRQVLRMPMDHRSTQVPAGAFAACGNCHPLAGAGQYFPGSLHSSLAGLGLPAPSGCSDCHTSSDPEGFVGPLATAPARSPASGEMKHDAVLWSNNAPTAQAALVADCRVCHVSPTQQAQADWTTRLDGGTTAQFHAPLASANLSQPGSCIDCHANSRPTTVLTSATATLPAGVSYDHSAATSLGECTGCHVKSPTPDWTSWSGARHHLVGSATPSTCLPCHAGERPTSNAGWLDPNYANRPFDYGTNAAGITHGAGQDCVLCHNGPGTGAWGSTQNWQAGNFLHGPTTLSGKGCFSCHMSQRPAGLVGTSNFDHAMGGMGDCFGCHQATVTANVYASLANWVGGKSYPGSSFIASPTQFINVSEIKLTRSGALNLVTGTASSTVTLFNGMLHTATVLPPELNAGSVSPPDAANQLKCWHCHTSTPGTTTVTSYLDGKYHSSLTNFRVNPTDVNPTPFPQPTSGCNDCHAQMRPSDIVERAASELRPMDHAALFTTSVNIGGNSVNGVGSLDCSACHQSPGGVWNDGLLHSKIATAVPQDCNVCHYPLMANAVLSDLTSAKRYTMKHRSGQVTFQNCQTCHPAALSRGATTPVAATLWNGGALHASVASQPALCNDCHAVTTPAGATQSSVLYLLPMGATATNQAQWMNHASGAAVGKDCAVCHASDAKSSGSAWSRATSLHGSVAGVTTCRECHGLTNGGGSVAGTNNNLPTGLIDSSTLTTVSQEPTTGVMAGTYDQVVHTDVNVSSKDCNFCHTQVGVSTSPAIAGREWAQAKFHVRFSAANPLVMNGTTGRCSNCHLNVKPAATYPGADHSTFSSAPGTMDCSSCHSWPGTGTAAAPNWKGAVGGIPPALSVGGFSIPQPPAAAPTVQQGITGLPHPDVGPGVLCTACHAGSGGGKQAFGYDHASTLINTKCNACHEAGSNLVGTVWNGSTTQAGGAGDTRPFTTAVLPYYKNNPLKAGAVGKGNHFYPVDCYQCHVVPAGNGYVTTGTAYKAAWTFPHTQSKMTNPGTCRLCHINGVPN